MRLRNTADVMRSNLGEYAKEQILNVLGKEKNGNRASDTAPDMEQTFVCKPLGTKKNPRFNSPVRIVVRSTRKRQTDDGAVSEKAVVDGLVKAGILKDDRKEYARVTVEEPELSQEEKTIIEIEEI
ncbi:MAG: hypothetical protein ACWGNI_00035 [Desulfobacterales bacterium]